MVEFEFIKMNGLGNDFVVIDQRKFTFNFTDDQIRLICHRENGIGCDQLILIRESKIKSSPLIIFYNSDGGEINACGNGARCVANFLMRDSERKSIDLITRERTIKCQKIDDEVVSINMGYPKFKWRDIPLIKDVNLMDMKFSLDNLILEKPFLVNIGNPHIIFFDDEIEKYDIESFGPIIENNHLFPEKINVSFAKLANKNNILLNVWERGAGRTKACGTAACASTIAGVELGILENKVTVTLPGGDLEIYYEKDSNVIMTGPTEINFTDKFKL